MPGQSFRPLDPGVLLNDLHRMAEMINRMDRLARWLFTRLTCLSFRQEIGRVRSGKGVPT